MEETLCGWVLAGGWAAAATPVAATAAWILCARHAGRSTGESGIAAALALAGLVVLGAGGCALGRIRTEAVAQRADPDFGRRLRDRGFDAADRIAWLAGGLALPAAAAFAMGEKRRRRAANERRFAGVQ